MTARHPLVSFRWSTGRGSHLEVMVEPALIDGRLQCRALHIEAEDGGAVTGDLIRELPVAELVRLAAERLDLGRDTELPPKDFAKDGMTEQALRDTLTVYEWCVRTGRKPTGVLEREYGIPRPKASRWIARARASRPGVE